MLDTCLKLLLSDLRKNVVELNMVQADNASSVGYFLSPRLQSAGLCVPLQFREGAHISTSLPVPHLLLLAPPCHVLDFCTFISCHCSSIGIFKEKGKNSDISIF